MSGVYPAGPGAPPFIERLTDRDRQDLMSMGRSIHLRSGATALIEGQVSGQVVLIERGYVRVWTTAEDGHESLLAIRRPGDLVGELSALDGRPHSASVSALEPVEARIILAGTFRDYLATHPSAAFAVLELLTERLRDADRKRAENHVVDEGEDGPGTRREVAEPGEFESVGEVNRAAHDERGGEVARFHVLVDHRVGGGKDLVEGAKQAVAGLGGRAEGGSPPAEL